MPIPVLCPCGKSMRAKEELAGRRVRCPACGKPVAVPPGREDPDTFEIPDPDDDGFGFDAGEMRETQASNPGRVRASYLKYSLCFPFWPLLFGTALIGSVLLALFVHWAFWPLAAVALFFMWVHRLRVSAKFLKGDVNPSLVVSADPPLIAVLADMDAGAGSDCHVIKILPHPLGRMAGKPREGTRLPTVSFYTPDPNQDEMTHWMDITPEAIGCATWSADVVERSMRTIGRDQWQDLKRALQQVPQPYEPGVYGVDLRQPSRRTAKPPTRNRMVELLETYLEHDPGEHRWLASDDLPPEIVQAVTDARRKDVLGIIQSSELAGTSQGLVLLVDRFVWNLGTDSFLEAAYADVWLATQLWPRLTAHLEIVRKDGTRHQLPGSKRFRENRWRIEVFLNSLADPSAGR